MQSITDWLGGLSGPLVYAVVAALVFAEDALFFGFVLPGETAVVVGGVVASQGAVSVWWVGTATVLAAVAGDSVGYEIGSRFGPRILDVRMLRRHRRRIDDARAFIRRRGPVAVFLSRFIAFFRAMMPALAGISHLRYRVFLLFNALGGLVWGVGFTALGYFAGSAYSRVEKLVGRALAVVVAALVVVALIVWQVRRKRRERAREGADGTPDGESRADGRAAGGGSTASASVDAGERPGGAGPASGDGRAPGPERPD